MHTPMTINHACVCVRNVFSKYIRLQGNNCRISVTPKAHPFHHFIKCLYSQLHIFASDERVLKVHVRKHSIYKAHKDTQ